MIIVLILIFSLVALAAAAFVVLPMLRTREATENGGKRRTWAAIAAGLVTMAVGLGTYAFLGEPEIALTELTGPSRTDYRALIATLARRMPQRPGDIEGWALLGRAIWRSAMPRKPKRPSATRWKHPKRFRAMRPPSCCPITERR
jgi:cytochrome c-type biogenesis protein CcmH/NrfG